MHDNKLRLSPDVINKAEEIAQTWGLKNARAAIEAVFRKYADDYQYGRQPMMEMLSQFQGMQMANVAAMPMATQPTMLVPQSKLSMPSSAAPAAEPDTPACDALSELDNLLGL